MADKNIGSLPNIETMSDDALFPAEQQGEAGYVSGLQFRTFAENAGYKAAASITQGPPGEGFKVLGYYETVEELISEQGSPKTGATYGVGTEPPYDIYIWDAINEEWKNNGPIQGAKGDPGQRGEQGYTFTPAVDADGNISWTNDGGLDNPDPVDITGPAGVSPSITVSTIVGGHRVTITDVNGTKYFDVMDGTGGSGGEGGEDGVTFYPAVDSNGYLTWTNNGGLTNPDPVKIVGEDGVSVTHSWNGTTLTVTSASGTSSANLKGEPGSPGSPGADATINGVNALTIATDGNISATQSGSTLTLGLSSVPSSSASHTVTLTTGGWSDNGDGRFKQTVSVAGVTASTPVIVVDVALTGTDLDADAAALGAWASADGKGPASQNITQGAGTLTFYCVAIPAINIPVNVGVA